MALSVDQAARLDEAVANLNKSVQINAEILEMAKNGKDTSISAAIAEHNGSDAAHNNSTTLAVLARDIVPYGLGQGTGTMPDVKNQWVTEDGYDDLDAIDKTGVYSYMNGAPTGVVARSSVIHVEHRSSTSGHVSGWQLTCNSRGLYVRKRISGVWSNWSKIHDTDSVRESIVGTGASLTIRDPSLTVGTIPETDHNQRLSFQIGTTDGIDNRIGGVISSVNSDGSVDLTLYAYKNNSENHTWDGIAVHQPQSGNATTTCPSPSTEANGKQVATADWVRTTIAGSASTSDERKKTQIADIPEAALRAWAKVNFKQFKYTEAVEKKGSEARLHTGAIAQQVIEAFSSEGLDATDYGLVCLYKWPNQYVRKYEEIEPEKTFTDPETGEVKVIQAKIKAYDVLVKEAGEEWGIRYNEAFIFEAAYQRWKLAKIEQALIAKGITL